MMLKLEFFPRVLSKIVPVYFRIQFKILTIVYKALHGLAPSYLADLLRPCKNNHYRSNDIGL